MHHEQTSVLFMSRKFPPSTGGMENFAYDLSESLQKEVKLHKITWGGANSVFILVAPIFFLRAVYILLTRKVDVIHMQDGLVSPMGYILSKLFRRPFVVIIHGLDITYAAKWYQYLVPRIVSRADHIICISQAAAKEAIKRGCSRADVTVIPLGCQETVVLPTKAQASKELQQRLSIEVFGRPIIMNVGRLVKRKGIVWFIDSVMPMVARVYPDILFLVVGDGEERQRVRESILRQGLEENVELLGKVDNNIMDAVYAVADVFVMPNIKVTGDIEGFGIVLIEAAVRQKPIVASNIEGILDATKHLENAIHVETGIAERFTEQISCLVDDPEKAKLFGAKAREYTIAHYSWASIVNRYIEIYERVINAKKTR